MAQEILKKVFNSTISPEDVIKWLTTDTCQDLIWVDVNQRSARAEFVACFLNFLRDQFASTQQAANNIKQTPSKKLAWQTSTAGVIITEPHKLDISGSSLNDHTDIGSDAPENTKQVSENSNSCGKLSELDKEVLQVSNNLSTENVTDAFVVATYDAQKSSTPVIKRRISLSSVLIKSTNLDESNSNFSKSSDGKLNYNESRQHEESNVSLNVQVPDSVKSFCIASHNGDFVLTDSNRTFSPTPTFSPYNSFASTAKVQSRSLNASFISKNYSQNECSDSSSQMSGNSIRSELQFSHSPLLINKSQNPISPLYSHSMMVTPQNLQKLKSKSSERQPRTNSFFQHSTPEQITNSSQKSIKSSSRQNLSLGDFMTIDTRSSKKSSGKKSNQKMHLLRHSKEDEIVSKPTPILTEESFPEVGQSFERRRRIKPTKLDVSGNKGNKENTVFGTVNRPVTANPQFSEVQSSDQTSDKISFEMERVLLRLERQKKPESTVDNKVGEPEIPIKIARPPRKPVLAKSIVVPSLAMVDKTELLNTCAQLYSAFIDNNLISNPMTEMYFLLSLITTQYLLQNSPCKSATKDTNVDRSYSLKSGELKQEELEEDLGCAVLIEETSKERDLLVQSAESNMLLLNETGEKLTELTLDDKSQTSPKILDEGDIISNEKNSFKIDNLHLGTPHNCVYFATRVLNGTKYLLKSLDRATLKLLSENVHIAAFQPDLQDYLIKLYHLKLSEVSRSKQQYDFSLADSNVCFQIDTDNRENFPSAIAFQCFRKQRDMFYEILKIWEENHTKSNWKFSIALSGKIKSMLTLHSDLTNHCHIARLFKSQLLISCIRSGQQQEDVIDDESLSLLKSLKGVNPEKLTQLKERLVTPLSSEGPVPEPSFPGVQEFYKNFILYAFNPMFYAHLEDCLIHEILEFNDAQFAGSDIEETETMVDERTKQNFVTCLSSLRLLAKFMGFLVSLPYRSTTSTLDEVINAQVALRSRITPSINLQACLQEAVVYEKLSLTIPWIVEYLSQLDIASLRLPYYTRLLEILYCIYRISDSVTFVKSEQFISQQTSVLIKFSLGWLFELSNFPSDLYFSWQSSHTSKKLKTICQFENQKMEVSVASDKRNISLDKLDIIDDRVLYSCCPFLVEFKVLLATGNSQSSNSKSNRHITPVSSQLPNTADGTNTKNLEFQLEEAFFHGQPASTRKTVEFVSERVASTCVKYICNSLLPLAREKSLNVLRKVIEEKYGKNFEDNLNSLKTLMLKDMTALAASLSKQVKNECEEVIPQMCEKRASQSIESLLAEDTLLPVKKTCSKIAIRMATDRIAQWIQSHIVGGSLFMRDMESEINRIVKSYNSVAIVSEDYHNPDAACPTDVLDDLRACMWELLDHKGKSVTFEFISKIFDQLCSCFLERADLIHGPENCLRSMSVDLSLFLITYRVDLFTVEIQEKFVKFWKINLKKVPESESALSRLLSPRNIMILEKSNRNEVWFKCGQFIRLLLKEEILSLESFSDQCVALLRQDWPIETLKNLSKCLNIGLEDYRTTDEQAERIRYLLRWIAETYKDIDNLDD